MRLNIKNDKTCKLARELADMTGESMTTAITKAIIERLERVREKKNSDLSTRLLSIGKDCASRLKKPFRPANHGELLFDKDGLPK